MSENIDCLRKKFDDHGGHCHTLMEISRSPVFVLSPKGKILALNKASENFFKISQEEAIGLDYIDAFLPKDLHSVTSEGLDKVFNGYEEVEFENDVLINGGERKVLLWNSKRLVDEDGEGFAILAFARDISSERQSQKELEDYKFALDHSSIVAITDKKGVITYVNDNFCQISKYDAKELLGKSHNIVNSGHHSREFFASLWKTIVSGQVWRGEIKNKSKDGSFYWVDTTIIPFLDVKTKRPYQFMSIRNDITARKQAEEDLEVNRLNLIQSEKMASLGVMAAGLAHEIGNPLGALRGRLEMLGLFNKEGALNKEKVLETSEIGLGLVDRISRIIKGLKAYARDGSKDPYSKISISRLVKDLLELTLDKAMKKGIKIECIGFEKDIIVECRETEVGQVIINILGNSFDAIADLPEKWVRLELEDLGSEVKLTISDSGHGIPNEISRKIFDPFFTTKPPGHGTGLGLSICNTIIADHKGRLEIDSKSSNTKFVVTLPKQHTQ